MLGEFRAREIALPTGPADVPIVQISPDTALQIVRLAVEARHLMKIVAPRDGSNVAEYFLATVAFLLVEMVFLVPIAIIVANVLLVAAVRTFNVIHRLPP